MFFSPFSIVITSLGDERANLSAFRTFVRFVLVWICRFPLPLGVWEGLWFVIVALPGLFSYLFLWLWHSLDFSRTFFPLKPVFLDVCSSATTLPLHEEPQWNRESDFRSVVINNWRVMIHVPGANICLLFDTISALRGFLKYLGSSLIITLNRSIFFRVCSMLSMVIPLKSNYCPVEFAADRFSAASMLQFSCL